VHSKAIVDRGKLHINRHIALEIHLNACGGQQFAVALANHESSGRTKTPLDAVLRPEPLFFCTLFLLLKIVKKIF
jgi:hypothetical protein